MRRHNPNSFNLYGDLDDVEVVEGAERVFDIQIANDEAERMRTFGDLLDCVERKLELSGPRVCLLRRAFQEGRGSVPVPEGLRLRPSLPLAALGEGEAVLLRWIDPSARRRAERPWRSRAEMAGVAALLVGPVLLLGWMAGGLVGLGILAALVAGFGVFTWRDQPPAPATVGALLRSNFHHLYPALARRHGPGLGPDRWQALESLCREISCYDGPVDRNTTFFSNQFPEGAR